MKKVFDELKKYTVCFVDDANLLQNERQVNRTKVSEQDLEELAIAGNEW